MTKQTRLNIYLTKEELSALNHLATNHFKMPATKVISYLIQLEFINNATMEINNVIKINNFKV